MIEFKNFHPVVNFVYFFVVIAFSMTLMHPVCLTVSLICSLLFSVVISGRKALKYILLFMLPVFVLTAMINPLFNHEGITILTYLPWNNPLTFESIIYGLCSACMIVNVICWFSCYNKVMTSDKFIYLFGKILPTLSLIISMSLAFVPKFGSQLKAVSDAQKGIGNDVSTGNLIQRAKHGITILSIMTTWALENAIDTADSMRSRGYGIPGRTSFSIFRFHKRDCKALICIILLSVYIFIGAVFGGISFEFFPYIESSEFSIYGGSLYASFFLLCIFPVVIEAWEVTKWNVLKSKI